MCSDYLQWFNYPYITSFECQVTKRLPFINYHSCCSGASLNTWRFCLFFGSLSTHPPLKHWSCRCNWVCVKANDLGHDKLTWTFCISWLFEKAQNRLFPPWSKQTFSVEGKGGGEEMYVPIWKETVLKLQLLERWYQQYINIQTNTQNVLRKTESALISWSFFGPYFDGHLNRSLYLWKFPKKWLQHIFKTGIKQQDFLYISFIILKISLKNNARNNYCIYIWSK